MAKAKPRRAAVIDIGSRSIRLIVGEKKRDQVTILELLKNILPLGRDTFAKSTISQETINATISTLLKYKTILATYAVTTVRVIATTAVREATNRDIFLDTVERNTGFSIEVLSVGDIVFYIDSYLYYNLQDRYPIHDRNVLIAELGAGTVDFSIMQKGYMLTSIGLPFGTLRLKRLESALKGSSEEVLLGLREYIENEFEALKKYLPPVPIDDVIIIGEDLSATLKNMFKNRSWDSTFFNLASKDAQDFMQRCCGISTDTLTRRYRLSAECAETASMMALTLNSFFTFFNKEQVFILETSLYSALLTNILFGYTLPTKHKTIDHLISVARTICTKFDLDLYHAEHVVKLGRLLFDGLRGRLGLKKSSLKYLILAAYFHDLGKRISNRSHHKHSQYIINSLNLFRLSEAEVSLVANIARYHRKATPSPGHLAYQALPPKQQLLTQKLAAVMRIADALDRSHRQKIRSLEITAAEEVITIKALADSPIPLERMSFESKKTYFEEITGNRINLVLRESWNQP